ncbi:MAG: hypothetical protein SPL13_00160, partial [Clostridia bacterium]|nr:hypothetical protein [Clostridia bacterium]
MIKEKKKFSILQITLIIIIAYSIMPIVARLFSMFFTTYAYLLVLIISFFSIIVLKGQDIIHQVTGFILPMFMMEILIYVVTDPSLTLWAYVVVLDLLPGLIGYYIVNYENLANKRVFFIAIIIAVSITIVTTIVGLQIYPNAARYLATVSDANESDNVLYNLMNIGGYEFVYIITFLYPAFIYGVKRKKIPLFVIIIYAIADFFLILNAGYTIALMLFFVSTAFLFFKRNLKVIEIFLILILAIIFVYIFFPLFSDLLLALSKAIDNKDISERLAAMAGGKEGLDQLDDNRVELYLISLNSIVQSPIFGGMFVTTRIGGHSFIIDFVAQYGLLGLLALIFIYRAVYEKFYQPYKNMKGYGYIFWSFLQVLIASLINTDMWLPVLTLFLPIIFSYITHGEGKE